MEGGLDIMLFSTLPPTRLRAKSYLGTSHVSAYTLGKLLQARVTYGAFLKPESVMKLRLSKNLGTGLVVNGEKTVRGASGPN